MRNHFEISDMFAALDSLQAKVNIISAHKIIRENINVLAKESLGCSDYRIQANKWG
jgi:hypothetical protein